MKSVARAVLRPEVDTVRAIPIKQARPECAGRRPEPRHVDQLVAFLGQSTPHHADGRGLRPLARMQLAADQTALLGAQAPRLRQALITIDVQVVRSVLRIVLHFPRSHPEAVSWVRLARALGAAPA